MLQSRPLALRVYIAWGHFRPRLYGGCCFQNAMTAFTNCAGQLALALKRSQESIKGRGVLLYEISGIRATEAFNFHVCLLWLIALSTYGQDQRDTDSSPPQLGLSIFGINLTGQLPVNLPVK